ncbi:diaminopimelate epimerase [Lutimonas zeaxanthinifaciens]|uniref:diaminopimelate epimerase n=1 Tax=Lutimonas zeaxanthinifaciens TaxID=3060215 RepID=UPI00265D0762|nr:diaminopimelate epimerase [Lutimonas sp. YSD2104]WKK65027.1 diaminopimelate epimerase [Lutimonas sp. YSD2104]
MNLDFFKYQGAGNDFVIVDNREGIFPVDDFELIKRICDRKFGVGADGFMTLEQSTEVDFEMKYYNADGRPGSMCGNGGRCLVAFAKKRGVFKEKTTFIAIGELYEASIKNDLVSLKMMNVPSVENKANYVFIDTGSPHHIEFTENVNDVDVLELGRKIRYGAPYYETGTNVNFVEQTGVDTFKVRTYERGVENETLSCGTGVTAVALAAYHLNKTRSEEVKIETRGGSLKISFEPEGTGFKNIVLTGPATLVFEGQIEI